LKEIIQILNRLREEGYFSDYAIGGGIATLFYTEPFATIDVDVFALLPVSKGLIDLSPIYDRLRELGGIVEGQYIRIGDQPVQLLVPPTALEEAAVKDAVMRPLENMQVPVFRAEYLIAIYVRINRPRDRIKIQALLDQAMIDQSLLRQIIERHQLGDQWNRYLKSNS
jgi:hypothetical protein